MNRGVKYRDVAEWLNALFALSVAWLNPSSQLRQSFDRFFSHHTASTVLSRQSLSHAYEALLTSYTGDTGKGVFPVESVYRPWTEDSSCLLPFSFSGGYLNGDAAMHLRAILSDLGIDEEQLNGLQPDHIAVELNVLALLLECNDRAAQIFFSDHLGWFGEFACLARQQWGNSPESSHYLELIRVTEDTLHSFREHSNGME